jgi:hypothetical protein
LFSPNKIDIQSVLVGIPANKFDNYKQHLHKTLLKSLSYYYLPKNKEKKLVYGIHTIKWLMEKGVVFTAVRLLKKFKK